MAFICCSADINVTLVLRGNIKFPYSTNISHGATLWIERELLARSTLRIITFGKNIICMVMRV